MKASEMLKKLQSLIEQHGDLRVARFDSEYVCWVEPADVKLEVCRHNSYHEDDMQKGESFFEIVED